MSFEKIASKCEILVRIYQLLDFEDQLRLACVTETSKEVYENHIWKEKYASLAIFYHNALGYVVTNESGVKRRHLTTSQFNEFEEFYGHEVLELTIENCYLEMEICSEEKIEEHINMKKFPNITKLHVKDMIVNSEFLGYLAEICPHLEHLTLDQCVECEREACSVTAIWDVESFLRMKHLKALEINFQIWQFSIDYFKLLEIIENSKLLYLKLDAEVKPQTLGMESDKSIATRRTSHMKGLSVKTSFPSFLDLFQNLSCLKLHILEPVHQDILDAVVLNYSNLEIFEITKTTFRTLNFPLPPKAKELRLIECKNLNFANLRQIMAHPSIIKLISRNTIYDGSCEDNFHIPPQLESLEMDCNYMGGKSLFDIANGNGKLKELIWYHPTFCRANPNFPNACPKLNFTNNSLDDPMGLLSLSRLKVLEKLAIPHPLEHLNWSYILELLKHHPSLTGFTIQNGCGHLSPQQPPSTEVAQRGFPTNIKELSLPLDIFELALDFWLDLFNCNENLTSLCCSFSMCDFDYDRLLKKLMEHESFPKDLKTIDIFGYEIECRDLRKHFSATIKKLNRSNCEDAFRILLCKTDTKSSPKCHVLGAHL
uniref:F-box domain-containing protein n=1 Tax=Stomoxys calcitrans TaxID=35570 RepID=A0A1I8Q9I0_STOCA